MTELLPCPFCGNREIQILPNGIGDYFAICASKEEDMPSCRARTSDVRCETEEQAARRWNCRPSAQQPVNPPQPYTPPFQVTGSAIRDRKDWYICEFSSPFDGAVRDAMVQFVCDAMNAAVAHNTTIGKPNDPVNEEVRRTNRADTEC